MKVIIADDSKIMREHLTGMLSNYKEIEIIGEAQDSIQAISTIRRLKPDVVILDIRLPGHGNGIDVLQSVKQEKPSPIVIMFTNYPFPQYRKKCMEAGAEYFFDKSSESHEMIRTLEELLKEFQVSGSRQAEPTGGSAGQNRLKESG